MGPCIGELVRIMQEGTGMHYFSPVDKMQLLEIIPGEKTSEDTLASASALGIKQGKLVVVVKECAGFFANRCLGPCIGELVRIMQEGTGPDELNKLATKYGFPVGLASLLDEVGIDVGHTVGKYLNGAYGARMDGGSPEMLDEFLALACWVRSPKRESSTTRERSSRRPASTQRPRLSLRNISSSHRLNSVLKIFSTVLLCDSLTRP